MRGTDPRLAQHTGGLRPLLAATGVLGTATAILTVAQAVLLATAIARAFTEGAGPTAQRGTLLLLALVLIGRTLLTAAQELVGRRAAARVKRELRAELLASAARGGAAASRPAGEIATLATSGLDALDPYVARYLPQVVLTAIVPLVILAALAASDLLAAATVAVTLPLIVVFLALVDLATERTTRHQVELLTQLGGHFLDVVRGLATLKAFRRSRAQTATIAEVSDRYRVATMGTLRLAFLSSLVLELVATLSVALVAVGVGLRLVDGGISLRTALTVLILAPEAYLPLRRLGALHHASAEGLAAAGAVLDLLDSPPATEGGTTAPDPARWGIDVRGLTVRHPDRAEPAPAGLSLTVRPGEVLAVTGRSGLGKTTLLRVLAGLLPAQPGQVLIGDVDLAEVDPETWRRNVAWAPQQPFLFAGTLADNIRLGRPHADDAAVAHVACLAALDELIGRLPEGLDTRVGEGGTGLSAGERRRVGLARAFLRDAPILLLDEPTADLDAETEQRVATTIRSLAQARIVVVVTHRPALRERADRVVDLDRSTPAPAALPVAAAAPEGRAA